jgi:predicted dehydrogenase
MGEYRAVVVGCGNRSHAHIQADQALDGVSVIACCAPTPTRREKVAAQYGLRAYADVAEMIRTEKPHLVHLVTWPDTRVELMTLVSELGVPACTVEKPIAVGVADWRALCELEVRTETKFAVSHQCRWQPNFVKCLQALQSGALGQVRFLDCSAGMTISGQGTHILNYAMALNADSPVAQLFGAASGYSNQDPGHPGPDTTIGDLLFENGVRGLWNTGYTAPRCGDPEVFWQHVRVAAYADRGHVEWQEFGKWEIAGPNLEESGDFGGMDTWQANNLAAQIAFHRAVLEWLEDDAKAPGTSLKQSLHEWKVVLALYASALWRTPIDLEDFDPPEDLFAQLAAVLQP